MGIGVYLYSQIVDEQEVTAANKLSSNLPTHPELVILHFCLDETHIVTN